MMRRGHEKLMPSGVAMMTVYTLAVQFWVWAHPVTMLLTYVN